MSTPRGPFILRMKTTPLNRLTFDSKVACTRLSDSGEDAKVKGTRKVGGLSPVSSRFTFVFALSQFSWPNYLGAWNRLTLKLQSTRVVVSN